MSPIHPLRLLLMICVCALVPSLTAKTGTVSERQKEIRQMRDEVLAELFKAKPELKSRVKKAAGYAVFSNVGVNLVIASFAGGHGIVVESGMISDDEVFMKMGSAGLGLGLGVKDFRALFIFADEKSLRNFVEKGWEFGGQADAAAKSDKKGAAAAGAASVAPGIEVYQLTKNGIALQATVQGTKYWKDKELN